MYPMYEPLNLAQTGQTVGAGWVPYVYVSNKLAHDFWSLLSMDWVDTKQFGL